MCVITRPSIPNNDAAMLQLHPCVWVWVTVCPELLSRQLLMALAGFHPKTTTAAATQCPRAQHTTSKRSSATHDYITQSGLQSLVKQKRQR